MRRRQFLTAAAGTSLVAGTAAGRAPRQSKSQSTPFEPLGSVPVDRIKEAVVDDAGDTVYAAVSDGFATIDVSNPATPTVLTEQRGLLADRETGPMQQVYDVKLDGDHLAVVGPANPGRTIVNAAVCFDVSDPAAPERVGVYETEYPIHNCDFVDGIAYLTGNRAGRNTLELVGLDGDPQPVGSWSIADHNPVWEDVNPALWTLHDVFVQDGRAYLAHWDAGTWIVDVSTPESPSLVSRVRGRPAEGLATLGGARAGLESLQPPGNDHYVAVDDDASLLGVGMESWDARRGDGVGGPSGIELWDISTPTDPTRLSTIAPPKSVDPRYGGQWTTSHNFQFAGDRLYTAWYQGGLRVFDVSDPARPVELAAWRDSDVTSFWTAQFTGDVVVASSGIDREQNAAIPDQLYTFPDPPAVDGADATPTATPGDDASLRPATNTTTTNATAANGTTGSDASGPGFGVLAALAGVGLGAWRRARRD